MGDLCRFTIRLVCTRSKLAPLPHTHNASTETLPSHNSTSSIRFFSDTYLPLGLLCSHWVVRINNFKETSITFSSNEMNGFKAICLLICVTHHSSNLTISFHFLVGFAAWFCFCGFVFVKILESKETFIIISFLPAKAYSF
jgi:hypothetical protein